MVADAKEECLVGLAATATTQDWLTICRKIPARFWRDQLHVQCSLAHLGPQKNTSSVNCYMDNKPASLG